MLRSSFFPTQAICRFLGCFWLLALPILAPGGEWRTLGEDHGEGQVCLKCPAHCEIGLDRHFFVITHGMRGTQSGDRFHSLGETIASMIPEANVVLVDWSEAACASWIPPVVACSINSIADEASGDLRDLGFQAEKATMIGESFGNYVNARIATNCGQVEHMIAMNPASLLGGYPVPDLRLCSRVSWSFHTYSGLDTTLTLAHATILLETPDHATDLQMHTCGIECLTKRLEQGDLEWIKPNRVLPQNTAERFRVQATMDGRFVEIDLPRIRTLPDEADPQDSPPGSNPST